MNRHEADEIYCNLWLHEYKSFDILLSKMKERALTGDHKYFVSVDNLSTYDEVFGRLVELGYSVEHYNGDNDGIIEISWG